MSRTDTYRAYKIRVSGKQEDQPSVDITAVQWELTSSESNELAVSLARWPGDKLQRTAVRPSVCLWCRARERESRS